MAMSFLALHEMQRLEDCKRTSRSAVGRSTDFQCIDILMAFSVLTSIASLLYFGRAFKSPGIVLQLIEMAIKPCAQVVIPFVLVSIAVALCFFATFSGPFALAQWQLQIREQGKDPLALSIATTTRVYALLPGHAPAARIFV
jgi:uncharacterized membrane protein YidH (DUF202 family)